MTHRVETAEAGIPRAWLLPLILVGMLVFVTAAGIVSLSIIPDFLAWWPVWFLLLLLVIFSRGRRVGGVRLSGLAPLVVAGALVVFAVGHVQAWAAMPSAAQRLIGPEVGQVTTAALSARIAGEIEIEGGGEFLYRVDPVRMGGEVGIPSASEQIQGAGVSVVLEPPTDPGFYKYAGWAMSLSSEPHWNLTLEGEIDADLRSLNVIGLQASGSGELDLGRVSSAVAATIDGAFVVSVPSDQAVRVIGAASVPADWDAGDDGFQSPVEGVGWVISVPEGSSVTVIDR